MDIYNHLGQLRTDFTPQEIASLDSDEKVLRLEALTVSAKNFRDAEGALVNANLAVKDAMATVDGIKAEKQKFFPPLTQHQAWLRDVKGVKSQSDVVATSIAEPGAQKPEGAPAQTGELSPEQWDAKISDAEGVVDGARALVRSCQDSVRRAREQVLAATRAWQAEYPPVSFAGNLKREFASDKARAEANVAQGLPPNYKGPAARPPSFLDAVAQHSHGGDANVRGGPAFRRGAHPRSHYGLTVKPKLPSNR